MTMTVVLIAETTSNFISALRKKYDTHVVRSGKQGIAKVRETSASMIVLDTISLNTNGKRICKQLRAKFPDITIIHLYNGDKLAESPADTVLYNPLPPRKLMASIALLTSSKQMTLLQCADFVLDLDRRILIAHGNEIALTPKESALVEAFLRNPNQTLERKWLMHHIWKTDYTGDTRTLNVHVRSVREAMEPDPNKPQFIKTVRGVGYRFEVPLNEKTGP